MSSFTDTAPALAELIRAVAWPGVTLFLVFRYRDHVGRLIDRLRKGGPAEFDPIPPAQSPPSSTLPPEALGSQSALAPIRTAAVIKVEGILSHLPALETETDLARRHGILLTIAAKASLVAIFERTESAIYASQLELLNHLNSQAEGESLDRLRDLFYAPAASRFADLYRNYSFEAYLNFLIRSMMVSVADVRAQLTPEGLDYLMWRVEQKKAPRLYG